MPQLPNKLCGKCRQVVPGNRRYCSRCDPDRKRPNSYRRGYGGRKWKRLRQIMLSRQPVCAECSVAPSLHVDHVLPKRLGGTNELSNLQGLCHACHSRKTLAENR